LVWAKITTQLCFDRLKSRDCKEVWTRKQVLLQIGKLLTKLLDIYLPETPQWSSEYLLCFAPRFLVYVVDLDDVDFSTLLSNESSEVLTVCNKKTSFVLHSSEYYFASPPDFWCM
jgi:hypothetical protein